MPYCINCGTEYTDGQLFCGGCGASFGEKETSSPDKQPKNRKKSCWLGFASGLLIVALLSSLLLILTGGDTRYEKGYDSPEEAATAYLEGLRDADVEKMLSSFAIESINENYHFFYYNYYNSSGMLNAIEGYEGLSASYRHAYATQAATLTYLTLAQEPENDFKYDNSTGSPLPYIRFDNIEDAADFADHLRDEEWMDQLASLEIEDFIDPEDYFDIDEDEFEDQNETFAEIVNAEAVAFVVAEVSMDDYDLIFIMDTVCYDGKWFNCGYFYASLSSEEATAGSDFFKFR